MENMKKLYISAGLGLSLLIVLAVLLLTLNTFPPLKETLGLPGGTVGRYQLHSGSLHGEFSKMTAYSDYSGSVGDELYKIDTVTGDVWQYSRKEKVWSEVGKPFSWSK